MTLGTLDLDTKISKYSKIQQDTGSDVPLRPESAWDSFAMEMQRPIPLRLPDNQATSDTCFRQKHPEKAWRPHASHTLLARHLSLAIFAFPMKIVGQPVVESHAE